MTNVISQDIFTANYFDLLEEAFEAHHGIFLDPGTSLFDTLAQIDAATASRPVGDRCATLAAQVAHVNYYLEVLERYIFDGDAGEVNWRTIWETVKEVTTEEWDAEVNQLKGAYQRVSTRLRSNETWDDENILGGALAIVVHSAYHLGEIRQALCVLQRG